jgi:hypothetical protein
MGDEVIAYVAVYRHTGRSNAEQLWYMTILECHDHHQTWHLGVTQAAPFDACYTYGVFFSSSMV